MSHFLMQLQFLIQDLFYLAS